MKTPALFSCAQGAKFFCVLLMLSVMWIACGAQAQPVDHNVVIQQTSMRRIKQDAQNQSMLFKTYITTLKQASDNYYIVAKAANFDYAKMAQEQQAQLLPLLQQARTNLLSIDTAYNQMEGIVAGVPVFSQYDIILASGIPGNGSAADDNDVGSGQQGTVVPFDLTLPSGRVLTTPGNLFDVLENILWGLNPQYGTKVTFDYQDQQAAGTLPDADAFKGATDALDHYTGNLLSAIRNWQPTLTEVLSALVFDLDNVRNLFSAWEITIFVASDPIKQFDMHVHSRITDLDEMIGGWQKIYSEISPVVQAVNVRQNTSIMQSWHDLATYVSTLSSQYKQDPGNKNYQLQQVELLGTETTSRGTTIIDLLVQVATKLKLVIE